MSYPEIEYLRGHIARARDEKRARARAERHEFKDATALTPEEAATVLAALRFYQEHRQGNPDRRRMTINEIATDRGDLVALDEAGIDDLAEKINGGPVRPRSAILD